MNEAPSRPRMVIARELAVTSWSEWDSVRLVKAAIRELELGNFNSAAQVIDAMGRDDRISGVMSTRSGCLPSLPMVMEPRGDGRQKAAVAAECDDMFEEMFPDDALSDLLHWGTMANLGIGQLVWETGTSRWLPRLKVFHPRFARWKWETRSYWVQAEGGELEITPGDGQWVLFTPRGPHRGWMKGAVRSLYVPWLVRQWGLRDWARYSEVLGNPIKKAVVPAGVEQKDREAFLLEVANLGAENTLVTERVNGAGDSEANRYDLELLEAVGKSSETFEHLIEMANACVAINLLGQNLSTEVKGGSFAAAKGHQQIREDILTSDAELLASCLRTQALSWWAMHNFGNRELAPLPMWKTREQRPEERKLKGEGLKAVGDGILALKGIGAKPDVDKILEADEIPVTGPAEEVEVPVPGSVPIGAPGAAGEGGTTAPGGKPKPAKGKVAQASQQDKELPLAVLEGQLFVDEVVDDGTERGRAALTPDLAHLLKLINAATSYEGLKHSLLTAYEGMDRAALAKVLRKTLLLAELAGKHSVLEEVVTDGS